MSLQFGKYFLWTNSITFYLYMNSLNHFSLSSLTMMCFLSQNLAKSFFFTQFTQKRLGVCLMRWKYQYFMKKIQHIKIKSLQRLSELCLFKHDLFWALDYFLSVLHHNSTTRDVVWPGLTRAYFWPALNNRLTRLWPGYFLTRPEEIAFDLKRKKLVF